jgi:hypothetical protein
MRAEIDRRAVVMASGLSIGFSIGLGGIGAVALGAVALGAIADSIDPRAALWVTAIVPVLAMVLGSALPSTRRVPALRPQEA